MRATIDASIHGQIILRQGDEHALVRLERMLAPIQLVQPAHWPLEIAGLLVRRVRDRRLPSETRAKMRDQLHAFTQTAEVDDRLPSAAIFETAIDYHLSVYDAAYLELAIRKGTSLMTRDGALADALARARVERLHLP